MADFDLTRRRRGGARLEVPDEVQVRTAGKRISSGHRADVGARADARLMRLFRRLGARSVWLLALVGVVNAVFATAIAALGGALYVDRSLSAIEPIAVAAVVMGAAAIAVTVVLVRRLLDPMFEWLEDPTEGSAEASWTGANRGLDQVILIGVALFSLAYVPVTIAAVSVLDLPAYDLITVHLYFEVGIIFAATLDYFALHRLVRPLVAEVAPFLPLDFEPAYRSPSLRLRLMIITTTVSAFVGVLTAANNAGPVGTKVATGLGVAAAVVLVAGLAPAWMLAEDVTNPFRALLRATSRVEAGDLTTRVPVLGADEGGLLARRFNRMLRGLQEREILRGAMGSYVDPLVAERVLSEGELLEGEEREATIMFVDIRGFTAWCDAHTASETVARLNDFFELVVPIVAAHGGHANKFLGDGLLAVFGVPDHLRGHADNAVAAASHVAGAVARRYGHELQIGIGVNTGTLVVGSIGGGGRLEYALIGDVVNVAARVEQLTKTTGDTILITDETRRALSRHAVVEPRGNTEVRGKPDPVTVHALALPTSTSAQAS